MTELLKHTDLQLDQQSLRNELENFDDDRNLWSDAQEIVAQATQIAWHAEQKIATQLKKLWYDPKTFGHIGQSLDGRVTWLHQARNSLEQTITELTNEIKKLTDPHTQSIFETKGKLRWTNELSEWEIISIVTKKLDDSLNKPHEWLIAKINTLLTQQQNIKTTPRAPTDKQSSSTPSETLKKKTIAQESLTARYASLDLASLNRSLKTKLSNEEMTQLAQVMSIRMQELESFLINTNATKPIWETLSKNRTIWSWVLLDVEYIWSDGSAQNIPFLTQDALGTSLYEKFTGWRNKFASQEDQFLQRAHEHMLKLWDTISHKRANPEWWSNVAKIEQVQQTKKNVITGKEIKQGQETQKETLDIIRPEKWMKEVMESRIQSEIQNIIKQLKTSWATPWSANPFHDARGGDHILEFDITGSMDDINVFDFLNPNNEKANQLSPDQKKLLKQTLEKSWNNDKLVAWMNQQFDIAWTKAHRESGNNNRHTELTTYKQQPLTQLLASWWPIATLTNQMKTLYTNESGAFGGIDNTQKMAMRKTEFLITELLAYCKTQIEQVSTQKEKNTFLTQYHALNRDFVAIISGTGNETMKDADTLEGALAEWEADRRLDYAIANIDSELYGKSPTQMVDLYKNKMLAIAMNFSQSDSFKKAVSYIHALGAKITEHIKWEILNPENAWNKKTYTDQLFRLVQMMRDRWEINVHNDFKNLEHAQKTMHRLMIEWGKAQEIMQDKLPQGKWQEQWETSSNKSEHIFSLLGFTESTQPDADVQETILTQMFGKEYNKTLTQKYSQLSLEHRALLDGLHTIKERNLSLQTMIDAHGPEQWVQNYMTMMQTIMAESRDKMMQQFADTLGARSSAWLQWLNKEMYEAFVDMHGTGWWFDVSDAQYHKNLWYADMGGWMVVAMVATLLALKTLGAWTWVAAAARSALISSLAWSSAWLAYEMARGRWFEDITDFGMEAGSTILADAGVTMLTLGIGKWVSAWFAKFGQGTKNLLKWWSASQKILAQADDLAKGITMNKEYAKRMAETGRDLGMEMPLGLYVEQQRQKMLTGQTVSLEAMISEMWPLMGIMAAMKLNDIPTLKGKLWDIDRQKKHLIWQIDKELKRIQQQIDAEGAKQNGHADTKRLDAEKQILQDAKNKLLEGKQKTDWWKEWWKAAQTQSDKTWVNEDVNQSSQSMTLSDAQAKTIDTHLTKAQTALEVQTWPNKHVSELFSLMKDCLINPTKEQLSKIKTTLLEIHTQFPHTKHILEHITKRFNDTLTTLSSRQDSQRLKFQNNINTKLSPDKAQLPLKDGHHEYIHYQDGKSYYLVKNEQWEWIMKNTKDKTDIRKTEFTDKSLKQRTIETYKASAVDDMKLFIDAGINPQDVVNKTSFAFSKDQKVPWDLDWAVKQDGKWENGAMFKIISKLIAWSMNLDGKVKITSKFDANTVLFELDADALKNPDTKAQILTMINNGTIRVEYDAKVTYQDGTSMSVNREIFVEDGKGWFEVDISKQHMMNINGVDVPFLSPDGYKKYVTDLIVADLAKDINPDKTSKLKIAKRIDDYMDTLSHIEWPKDSRTILMQLIEALQKFLSNAKKNTAKWLQMMITILEADVSEADGTRKPEKQAFIDHFKTVIDDYKKIASWWPGNKVYEGNLNQFMNQTSQLKSAIKNLKKDIAEWKKSPDEIAYARANIDKQIADISQYDFSDPANFALYHEWHLVTKHETYALPPVGNTNTTPSSVPGLLSHNTN